MRYVLGALAGLLWGALAAYANGQITKRALKKNSAGSLMASNTARMAVDVAALGLIFLLRRWLPFSFEAALVATAVTLSLLNIVFSYRLAKPEGKQEKGGDGEKENE